MGAAGVQLVKLTPYRSYIFSFFTLQCISIMSIVGFKGGIISYSSVRTHAQGSLCQCLCGITQCSLPAECI